MDGKTHFADDDTIRYIAKLQRERDGWIDSAKQFSNGLEYYQGLIDEAAKSIGIAMYTADDKGVHPEPLRAKLPECVADLVQQRDELETECAVHAACTKARVEQLAAVIAQRDDLKAELEEAVSLRVSLWRNGDFDGDDDKLSDLEVAMKDPYAKKWVSVVAKVTQS